MKKSDSQVSPDAHADRLIVGMPTAIDSGSITPLWDLLTAPMSPPDQLVLDLARVRFVDTGTVPRFVALRRRFAGAGTELVVTNVSPAAEDFLLSTGLHRTIHTVGTPEVRDRVA